MNSVIGKSSSQQVCACEKKDYLLCLITGIGAMSIVAYFFYKSVLALLFLWPVGIAMFIHQKKQIEKRKKQILSGQFKEMLLSVASSMKAGYAAENAFRQATKDMSLLFGNKSLIYKELVRINLGLNNNLTLEELLKDFGYRSGIEDISEFGEVFKIAKRSGGNLMEIMDNTILILEERLEVEKEIQVVISAKEMERKVMSIIPFFIIFYIQLSSPGFLDGLYRNISGIVIMTIALVLYVASFYLSEKIISIEV